MMSLGRESCPRPGSPSRRFRLTLVSCRSLHFLTFAQSRRRRLHANHFSSDFPITGQVSPYRFSTRRRLFRSSVKRTATGKLTRSRIPPLAAKPPSLASHARLAERGCLKLADGVQSRFRHSGGHRMTSGQQDPLEQPQVWRPLIASIPSCAMMGTMQRAATGSAHQSPKAAFRHRPPSTMADK